MLICNSTINEEYLSPTKKCCRKRTLCVS